MKTALPALFGAACLAAAAAFPVDVDSEMNGLAITVRTSSGIPLVITFVSQDKADATCKAEIANAFDTPQDRTATVKAGKSVAIPFTLGTSPNRVRVKVTCVPMTPRS